jgi:hypothetical protein
MNALDFCGAEVVGIDLYDSLARFSIDSFFLFTLAPPPAMTVLKSG